MNHSIGYIIASVSPEAIYTKTTLNRLNRVYLYAYMCTCNVCVCEREKKRETITMKRRRGHKFKRGEIFNK